MDPCFLSLTLVLSDWLVNEKFAVSLHVSTVAFHSTVALFLLSNTSPNGQLFLWVCLSFNLMMSAATRLRRSPLHSVLTCRFCKYSPLDLDHNWSAWCAYRF